MKRKMPSRHNLRRIIISLLIVILASLSPNIAAAASPEDRGKADREFTERLIERNSAVQDQIDTMRKQMLKAVRSKGMQFSGGLSTNRLLGNTVGRTSRSTSNRQSRLPDTGIHSRQSAVDSRTMDRFRTNNRATDVDFERVKGMLDTLENRLRGNRRELKKHTAAHREQNGADASVRQAGQMSDRHLIAMEHETARIEEEVSNYLATAARSSR
ncbi:MAG: hypothetical protein IIB68_08425 [Proteobacteria bacterium]|nr:hypothetical protein [Pseudomonadota bacterium]